MKVSLVSLHTSPLEVPGSGDAGGLNVVVDAAAHALVGLGHEVAVFTRASVAAPAGSEGTTNGVTVVALDAGDPALPKSDLPGILPDFAQGLAAHPFVRASSVIHAHYWLSASAARPVASKLGVPLFTTFHTVAAQKNAHGGSAPEPALRLREEKSLAHESVIIAGSSSELDGISRGYGTPSVGSHIVTPGVDTTLFTPSATSHGSRPLRILVLGRVQPLKGQDLALEAFLRWTASGGLGSLTIAGEPTPDATQFYRHLQHTARSAHAPVTFLPAQSRESAATLLREHDLVLIPSHSETFGLVALEAAASATPVLAARTTGLLEAVGDGSSGILIDGRDPQQWADHIARLAANRDELQRLRTSSRAHAEAHSWEQHAAELLNVYSLYTTFGK